MIDLYTALLWYLIFVISTTLHEASHGLLAKWGGDPTAYLGGQVSIDPIPHIMREPIGMVVLPILSAVFYGWPIGYASIPFDANWAQNYPRRAAIMSLAGPAANFAIALVCGLLIRWGLHQGFFAEPSALRLANIVEAGTEGNLAGTCALVLSMFFSMNLMLAVFNLLPIPPLDGAGAVPLFVSRNWAAKYQSMIEQPYMALAGMFLAWNLFPKFFGVVYTWSVALLFRG